MAGLTAALRGHRAFYRLLPLGVAQIATKLWLPKKTSKPKYKHKKRGLQFLARALYLKLLWVARHSVPRMHKAALAPQVDSRSSRAKENMMCKPPAASHKRGVNLMGTRQRVLDLLSAKWILFSTISHTLWASPLTGAVLCGCEVSLLASSNYLQH